jgi:hypothetical protein
MLIEDTLFHHQFIICDITPDAILGQDFLLRHVKKTSVFIRNVGPFNSVWPRPVELTDSCFPGFVGFCFVSDHDHYSLLG